MFPLAADQLTTAIPSDLVLALAPIVASHNSTLAPRVTQACFHQSVVRP